MLQLAMVTPMTRYDDGVGSNTSHAVSGRKPADRVSSPPSPTSCWTVTDGRDELLG